MELWVAGIADSLDETSIELAELLSRVAHDRTQIDELLYMVPGIRLGAIPQPSPFTAIAFWPPMVLELRRQDCLKVLIGVAAKRFPTERDALLRYLMIPAPSTSRRASRASLDPVVGGAMSSMETGDTTGRYPKEPISYSNDSRAPVGPLSENLWGKLVSSDADELEADSQMPQSTAGPGRPSTPVGPAAATDLRHRQAVAEPGVPYDSPLRRRKALVIGIVGYDNYDDLRSSSYDVDAVVRAIENDWTVTRMDSGDSVRNINGFIDAIDDFFEGVNKSDSVLFYFSGHGDSHRGEFVMCVTETRRDRLTTTAFSFIDLQDKLRDLVDRRSVQDLVLFFDCCASDETVPLPANVNAAMFFGRTRAAEDRLSRLTESFVNAIASHSDNGAPVTAGDVRDTMRANGLDPEVNDDFAASIVLRPLQLGTALLPVMSPQARPDVVRADDLDLGPGEVKALCLARSLAEALLGLRRDTEGFRGLSAIASHLRQCIDEWGGGGVKPRSVRVATRTEFSAPWECLYLIGDDQAPNVEWGRLAKGSGDQQRDRAPDDWRVTLFSNLADDGPAASDATAGAENSGSPLLRETIRGLVHEGFDGDRLRQKSGEGATFADFKNVTAEETDCVILQLDFRRDDAEGSEGIVVRFPDSDPEAQWMDPTGGLKSLGGLGRLRVIVVESIRPDSTMLHEFLALIVGHVGCDVVGLYYPSTALRRLTTDAHSPTFASSLLGKLKTGGLSFCVAVRKARDEVNEQLGLKVHNGLGAPIVYPRSG